MREDARVTWSLCDQPASSALTPVLLSDQGSEHFRAEVGDIEGGMRLRIKSATTFKTSIWHDAFIERRDQESGLTQRTPLASSDPGVYC